LSLPNLATLDDAAKAFSVSTRTIRRRIADGTVTGYRLGPRLIRVDMDELALALAVIPTVSTKMSTVAPTYGMAA
jgi:excisionase family DNA binding protein